MFTEVFYVSSIYQQTCYSLMSCCLPRGISIVYSLTKQLDCFLRTFGSLLHVVCLRRTELILNFVKSCQLVQKMKWKGTYKRQVDFTSLFLFLSRNNSACSSYYMPKQEENGGEIIPPVQSQPGTG